MVFGSGATVDVNGLVATTANISNDAFINAAGSTFTFDQPGNPNASIINNGTITARAGRAGRAGMPNVINNGVITAKLGTVQLASGDTATIDMYGDSLMEVAVSDQVKSQLVANNGLIAAEGGKVALTAAAGSNIVNSLITVPGEILTPAVAQQNGEILIYAEGSNAVANNVAANKGQVQGSGTVQVSGTLDTSGQNAGETGGNISVLGDNVNIQSGAVLDASGRSRRRHGASRRRFPRRGHDTDGRSPPPSSRVPPSTRAATDSGNGGNVAVWSDRATTVSGSPGPRAA